MEDKYRFEESGHCHYLGDKKLTGITTILNVISKPQLISWASKIACEYVKENLKDLKDLDAVLELAKIAHQRKKEQAGQKGTDIHALIEKRIKEVIDKNKGLVDGHEVNEEKQVSEFIDWAMNNKIKFIESELHIYSQDKFLGGICDFVCEINKEIWLGDIKTGGIYPEAFFQMAGYQICIEEMGLYKNIKGHIIIGLKDGLNEKRSISNNDNKTAFLSALSLYRIMAKVNGSLL